jgi:RHS repeat-associated protein
VSGAATATFVYDGDGNRVKGTVGGVTITYIGNYYEWSGSTATSYYYAGSIRVAIRQGSTLSYMFADHLGSTSVVANSSGSKTAEVRYKAWGEDRYTSGTVPSGYRFTGQRVEASLGLYFYGARWYDASLGRFLSADSIVPNPGDPQAWDRYAYSYGNPVKYIDPTGHWSEDALNQTLGKGWREKYFSEKAVFRGRENLLEFLLSKNTADAITLEIVRSLFNAAYGAHSLGADFQDIDALGARVSLSGGGAGFVGGTIDAILNLTSGEMSIFASPEGGFVLGATATLVGGIVSIKNMPSNAGYRGTAKAVGLMGGDIIGANAEKFWGGVHVFQDSSDVLNGSFVGTGGAVPFPNIGLYGSMSYAFEALSVDKAGYNWLPDFPGPVNVLSDLGEVLWHDILGQP